MPLIDVTPDHDAATLTVVAEFAAAPERVWQVWADPRLLERWWGPPMYPATVTEHDLRPEGWVRYYMTGPEGDRHHGWWRVARVEPGRSLVFEDGFADESGQPNLDLPVTSAVVTLEEIGDGTTRMAMLSTFPSREALDQLLEMGMAEGLRQSVAQIDDLL